VAGRRPAERENGEEGTGINGADARTQACAAPRPADSGRRKENASASNVESDSTFECEKALGATRDCERSRARAAGTATATTVTTTCHNTTTTSTTTPGREPNNLRNPPPLHTWPGDSNTPPRQFPSRTVPGPRLRRARAPRGVCDSARQSYATRHRWDPPAIPILL
jgi:hypothetical protein